MNFEDILPSEDLSKACVVCGKTLLPGEATATIHQGEAKLPICCPRCLEAYQADPKPYLDHLARRTLLDELRHPPNSST